MRDNGPVTGKEIGFDQSVVLVSRTDTGGRIEFANPDFIKISGFTEDELLGQPHNIVRHPDMPKEAFRDLWETVKAGVAWEGFVKNRAKSGDHYWVKANVTPVMEGDTVQGYISIRTRPTDQEKRDVEALYAGMRQGTAQDITLRRGDIVSASLGARIGRFLNSIQGRVVVGFGVVLMLMATLAGLGLYSQAVSTDTFDELRSEALVEMADIKAISDAYAVRIVDASHKLRAGTMSWDQAAQEIAAAEAVINPAWSGVFDKEHPPEERVAIDRAAAVKAETDAAVTALKDIVAQRNSAELISFVETRMYPAIDPFTEELGRFGALLQDEAVAISTGASRTLGLVSIMNSIATLLAIIGAVLAGLAVTRVIRASLMKLEGDFEAIGRDPVSARVASPAVREFHGVTRQLRALQARICYAEFERAENARKAEETRRDAIQAMADTVEAEARSAVNAVVELTRKMANDAKAMAASAGNVTTNAVSVSAAADQSMQKAQTVASASEELAASIGEISGQMGRASAATRDAVEIGERAQGTIRSLSESVQKIGEVSELIRGIAEQTNLLALNATIEAARAGEAGKGFAVVASEVKQLANQTAKATEEISRQINDVQGVTSQVVQSVDEMGRAISEVDQISASVAAAMEEQTAATGEISRSVVETTEAAEEVSRRIAVVSEEAESTSALTGDVERTSHEVEDAIRDLSQVIVEAVRTATTDADRRAGRRERLNEAVRITLRGETIDCTLRDRGDKFVVVTGIGSREVRKGETLSMRTQGGATQTIEIVGEVKGGFRGRVVI